MDSVRVVARVGADAGIGAGGLGGVLHEGHGDRAAGIHRDAIDIGQIQQIGFVGLKIHHRENVRCLIGRVNVLPGTVDEDARTRDRRKFRCGVRCLSVA